MLFPFLAAQVTRNAFGMSAASVAFGAVRLMEGESEGEVVTILRPVAGFPEIGAPIFVEFRSFFSDFFRRHVFNVFAINMYSKMDTNR